MPTAADAPPRGRTGYDGWGLTAVRGERAACVKAERHFAKGEAFERQQAKLDETTDVETIVESGILAAHHFICAGADWHGQAHPSTHSHGRNPALLKSSGAPSGVELAWGALERLRGGSVY